MKQQENYELLNMSGSVTQAGNILLNATKDWVENTVAILHTYVVRPGGSMDTDLANGRTATVENFGLTQLWRGQ